jgi:RNA polymerase sigma factor (sigma-70 family)
MPTQSDTTTLHVRRACGGEEQSLAWVVERFTPLLRAQATVRLHGVADGLCDADDLVQEVWAVALPRLEDLNPRDERLSPVLIRFLATTLLNKVNNLMMRRLRRGEGLASPLVHDSRTPTLERFPDSVTGALERAARDEAVEELHAALERLGERDREILVLRGIEQLEAGEVARRLGLKPSAVSMRYRRALDRLAEMLPGSIFEELAE